MRWETLNREVDNSSLLEMDIARLSLSASNQLKKLVTSNFEPPALWGKVREEEPQSAFSDRRTKPPSLTS